MRFRPEPLDIPEDSPFSQDALGLEPAGNALTRLLESGEGPCVIAVDASWGFGKSTFLDMWAASYKQQGGQVIQWNAWENDYCEDVFVSLFEEISEQMSGGDKAASAALGHARRAAKSLLRHGVPLAIRLSTAGMLSGRELEDKGLGEFLEQTSTEYLESYLERKRSVAKFRAQLGKFVNSRKKKEGEPEHPVVMVVDELDRCRPSFSLEALETIKHLFGLDGLVFVLGVDLDQLGNAIQGAYGPNFDGKGYLRRLIDVRLSLPEPDMDEFIENLVNRYGMSDVLKEKKRNWLSTPVNVSTSLKHFARLYGLSLRDAEQAVFQMNLYLGGDSRASLLYPTVAAFLIALRQNRPDDYHEFFRRADNFDDLWSFIESLEPSILKLSDDAAYLLELEMRVLVGGFQLLNQRINDLRERAQDQQPLDEAEARILDLGDHIASMFGHFNVPDRSIEYVRARIELFHGLGER